LVERRSGKVSGADGACWAPDCSFKESRLTGGIVLLAVRKKKRESTMLILLIVLLLIFGFGGGYYGRSRWGNSGGAGVGVGTILVVLLIAWMLGVFH
jgi:hypothetical protein